MAPSGAPVAHPLQASFERKTPMTTNVPSAPRRGGWKRWLAALIGGASTAQAAAPQVAPPVQAAAPAPAAPVPVAQPGPAARLPRSEALVYKSSAGSRLRLHFAWPSEQRFTGPRPCVVFFHGGGWRTGQPKQFMAFAERLAEVGVVGISAQYRLMGEADVLPMGAIQDARSALRFVRAKAAQLGCDPQRIGAGGGSSGGHLAAMTAVAVDPKAPAPAGPIDDPADDLGVSPRPNALFLMNAPLNLDRYSGRPVPAEQRRQLSPTLRIDASLPPTWIFHGTGDKLVPFSQATEFRDKARALGAAEVTVHAFDGRTHGFFNAKRSGDDFEATVAGIVGALKKLGWVT
jgi:acetyl esterase